MSLGYVEKDGKQYIILSQSLIKKFIRRGDIIEFCPWKVFEESIRKRYRTTSEAMTKGLFFETKVLGSSAKGQAVHTLPKKLNGKKYIWQIRIESQILEARKDIKRLGVSVNKLTTQQKFARQWHGLDEYGIIVIITGELDVLSHINKQNGDRVLTVIDHKLTADLSSVWGDFAWGAPETMDHIQAHTYNFLTGLPFVYFIYDFKPNLAKKVPLPVEITDTIRAEFNETVRKACAIILEQTQLGWKPRPGLFEKRGSKTVNMCDYCKVQSCEFYNNIQPIKQ
jgi:hypothetical protein